MMYYLIAKFLNLIFLNLKLKTFSFFLILKQIYYEDIYSAQKVLQLQNNLSKSSNKLNHKLEHLIGEYTPFQDDIIDMITLEFMY